jgi:nucleoside-diphosphate-sugar epimerase
MPHQISQALVTGGAGFIGSHIVDALWDMICSLSGSTLKPQYQPARSGDIYASVASIEYAKSLVNFEIDFPFEQGLELTYRWYQNSQRTEIRGQKSEDG